MRRRLHIRPVLALCILLAGCGLLYLGLSSALFTGGLCATPCGQSLIPGQSSGADVEQFINQLDKTWVIEPPFDFTPFCKSFDAGQLLLNGPHKLQSLSLYVVNDRLTLIESFLGIPPFLFQINHQFGNPEYYRAVLAIGPDGQIYLVDLYYPQKGVKISLDTRNWGRGQFSPFMFVKEVTYTSPGSLVDFLVNEKACFHGTGINAVLNAQWEINRSIRPWAGYGKVKFMCEGWEPGCKAAGGEQMGN